MKRIGWTLLFGLVMAGGLLTAADPAAPAKRLPVFLPEPTADETRIEAILNERVELAFSETPLSDALKFLHDQHQINIWLDVRALEDEGVDPATPISLELSGVSLRSAFRLMLKPLGLTAVCEDDLLKVTQQIHVWDNAVTRVYPVRDLAETAEEFESLQEAIQTATGSVWDSVGAMSLVPKSKCIVVRHNRIVHEDIVELLTNLRAAHALTLE